MGGEEVMVRGPKLLQCKQCGYVSAVKSACGNSRETHAKHCSGHLAFVRTLTMPECEAIKTLIRSRGPKNVEPYLASVLAHG
jgi:hypothetical protein